MQTVSKIAIEKMTTRKTLAAVHTHTHTHTLVFNRYEIRYKKE